MRWPDGGPWLVAPAGGGTRPPDWALVVRTLAAQARTGVAVVQLTTAEPAGPPLAPSPPEVPSAPGAPEATYLRVDVSVGEAPGVQRIADVVGALGRTHGVVLVCGDAALAEPVAGWTPADLAAALEAPVVVVADDGPGGADRAAAAVSLASGHGCAATVVAVGGPAARQALRPLALAALIDPSPDAGADAGSTLPAFLQATGAAADDPLARLEGTEWGRDARRRARRIGRRSGIRRWLPGPGAGRRAVVAVGLAVLVAAVAAGVAGVLAPERDGGVSLTVEHGPPPGVYGRSGSAEPVHGPSDVPSDESSFSARPCPAPSGAVRPARPDAATSARVNAVWGRIERWLAVKAPKDRARLRAPASFAEIDAAQRRIGRAFPADLVASLRRHDGAPIALLPVFYEPMPVARIVQDWAVLCGVADAPEQGYWRTALVPFGEAGDGGNLYVDERGRVGSFFAEEGITEQAGSVVQVLEDVARSLETGEPVGYSYPAVTVAGHLTWVS